MQMLFVMALAGGVLTFVMVLWHTARRQKDRLAIPYGVAIAFAGLWVLAVNYLPAGSALAASAHNPILTSQDLRTATIPAR
jgi:prepilin peptidase CpaA